MFETTHRRQPAQAFAGSPSQTCCGRHGSSTGDELAAGKRDATLLAHQAAGRCRHRHRQRRRAVAPALRARLSGERRGHRLRPTRRDGHPQRPLQGDGADGDRSACACAVACTRRRRGWRGRTPARKLKFTLPGPMTIVDTIADTHYGDRVALAMAFAALLNEEARALQADGVDVIQFDEPAFNVYMDAVNEWGIAALERAARRAQLQDRGAHLLRLRHPGEHRLEGHAGLRVAAVRGDLPGAGEKPDRPGLAGVPQLACADGVDAAARGQGRAGRRDRCRDRSRGDARGGRRHYRGGAVVRAGGAAVSLHATAAWRRCGARWRRRSWRHSAPARPWRGSGSRRRLPGTLDEARR